MNLDILDFNDIVDLEKRATKHDEDPSKNLGNPGYEINIYQKHEMIFW